MCRKDFEKAQTDGATTIKGKAGVERLRGLVDFRPVYKGTSLHKACCINYEVKLRGRMKVTVIV